MKIRDQSLAALLAVVPLSIGCEVEETLEGMEEAEDAAPTVMEDDGLADEENIEELAAALEPVRVSDGWTLYTSEEQMPVNCYPGSAVSGVQCRGSYCDDIRLRCNSTGKSVGGSNWTSYFSEEQAERICPDGHWVTALGCRGKYCDNISLLCTQFPNANENGCYWTGWISEEGGGRLTFGSGYFARGAVCGGRYCDNKRFYVCKM